jgi:hypothetical protein
VAAIEVVTVDTAERAVAWLRALSEMWRAAEVPAERADLLHASWMKLELRGVGPTRRARPRQ